MDIQQIPLGNGFDILFDTIDGENIDNSMKAIKFYSNIVTIQANSSVALNNLQAKSGSLHVLMLISLLHNIQRERHGKILEKIAELVDQSKLKPLLAPHLYSFNAVGKFVIAY